MGFTTLLDITGSILIGGLLLLILFNMRQNASEINYQYQGDRIMQSNLTSTSELLNYYLDRIGYNSDPLKATMGADFVLEGRDTAFSFTADMNSDGSMDNVVIALGNPVTSSINPSDRWLEIKVNGNLKRYSIGLQSLDFEYYNFNDVRLSAPLNTSARAAVYKYTVNISVVDVYQMPDPQDPLKVFTKTIDSSRRNLRGNFIR